MWIKELKGELVDMSWKRILKQNLQSKQVQNILNNFKTLDSEKQKEIIDKRLELNGDNHISFICPNGHSESIEEYWVYKHGFDWCESCMEEGKGEVKTIRIPPFTGELEKIANYYGRK